MADWSDVERIASGLPEVAEIVRFRNRAWTSGTVFVWERPFSKADRGREPGPLPEGPILAVRVADQAEKGALLAAEPEWMLTIQHFDRFDGLLVQLDRIPVDRLAEVITDAWFAVSPRPLVEAFLAEHPELRDGDA